MKDEGWYQRVRTRGIALEDARCCQIESTPWRTALVVPFGYVWHREAGLGLDPDIRIQEVIRFILTRFRELGSARQVLLSMTADQIHFPRPSDEGRMTRLIWKPARYRNVIGILKNPFYAGVYVYGKSEKRTSIVDGRARRSYGHGKPI
jgi:hypothetical protein